MTRRDTLLSLAAGAASAVRAGAAPLLPDVVKRHDASVDDLLKNQDTSPNLRRQGAYPDAYGLYSAGSAAQVIESFSAAFVCPESRFHKNRTLPDRIKLAAGFLERSQSPEGNISLLSTNFNSTPDTGFVVHLVASGSYIARLHGSEDIARLPEAFLRKAGAALAVGGIHTPNHRWVVSSALAQINQIFPDPSYTRRINQWLAEGIDIDADGEFTERSMLTYNMICDRAFIVLANKLKRPELLDPVRRNLDSLLYLLHADGELVTEISRRQDVNVRGDFGRYWFSLRYMAINDGNGQFATLAEKAEPANATLPFLLEYPELSKPLPKAASLPVDFIKPFPQLGIVRFRRGPTSATIIQNGNNRFFSLHNGDAVINAVRFASAFFGRGQFIGEEALKRDDKYVLTQNLEAGYYQPLDHPVDATRWAEIRAKERKQTQICKLTQRVAVARKPRGFRLRILSDGTPGVPLAVEVSFREGGTLQNCAKSSVAPDTWVLGAKQGSYKAGKNEIRFGPGLNEHIYTQVRGAEPKLPGQSVYLTGYTPFDHTIDFECL